MKESLAPVVYWFTRGVVEDYDRCLMERIIAPLRPAARHYMGLYLGRGEAAQSPDGVIFTALAQHQSTLLKPYVPRLRPDQASAATRKQSVVCAWPEWTETGMVVELEDGRIGRLAPPLPVDRQMVEREFDGQRYEFRFYRTDEMEQRMRWFRYVLRETMARERLSARLDRETPTDPSDIAAVQAGPQPDYDFQLLRDQVLALLDPEDRKALASDRKCGGSGERTQHWRARKRMTCAATVLRDAPADPAARRCLTKLRAAPDGKRAAILMRYADVHDLLTPLHAIV